METKDRCVLVVRIYIPGVCVLACPSNIRPLVDHLRSCIQLCDAEAARTSGELPFTLVPRLDRAVVARAQERITLLRSLWTSDLGTRGVSRK